MSTKKVRTKIRSKTAGKTEWPVAASASSGQTKVVEYFRITHRDPTKKYKRLKIFGEDDELEKIRHTLESPNKMARLKSPQTSLSGNEIEKSNQEWVLPVTSQVTEKTDVTLKNDEVKKNDDDDDKSVLEIMGKSEPSASPTKKIAEIGLKGKEKEIYGAKKTTNKTKHDAVNDVFVLPENERDNAINDDLRQNILAGNCVAHVVKVSTSHLLNFSILPSAVKLVENIKNSTGSILSETLPLPAKYERLLRLFEYTEVVSWLETQGKRITLNEVMTNVQRKLKSNYDEQHFAMILSVYPESYIVRCERRWLPIGGRPCSLREFEYVIEPNLINDIVLPPKKNVRRTAMTGSSPLKSSKIPLISLTGNPSTLQPLGNPLKSPTKSPSLPHSPLKLAGKSLITGCPAKLEDHRLLRKLEFRNRLRTLVNMQHAIFLRNEGIEILPDEQLPRYHPDFDLNAVDDITPAKLPEIPKGDAGQPGTMREYLKAVPDSSGTLPDKIKRVIKELRSPEKQVAVVADKCIPLSPKKYHVETKNTIKSEPSLLERIRAKERERKRLEMMRNPEMEQKKGRLERISRSLLQCIWSYYNLKKVGSMKFVELVDKLAFSIGSISKVEIEASINLLCDVCPSYFKMVEVKNEKYVHLKNNSFLAIRDAVDAEIKKCI
uniref:CDT1 Geminin-binding domain-containing protein n=1 Tax=Setaria digitata TaxID=48799 RepID=A0A915PRE9_9BILA